MPQIVGAIDIENERFIGDRIDLTCALREQIAHAAIRSCVEFIEPRARQQRRHAEPVRVKRCSATIRCASPRAA